MSDKISIEAISAELRAAIANLDVSGKVEQTGVVTRVGDGVAWIYGLSGCGFNELIDIVDNIIHTSYKECQFTESFVDRYFTVLKQLRQGVITHYEFASQVYRELMSMRSQLAIAGLKDKEVELVNFG